MHTTPSDSQTELARFLATDDTPQVSYLTDAFNTLRTKPDST